MKVQIYSDLHVDINNCYDPKQFLQTEKDTELYLDAGDTGEYQATIKFYQNKFWRDKKVLFVGGNHLHYAYGTIEENQNNMKKLFTPQDNVTYLQDSEFVYKDFVVIGCTLWTDFNVFNLRNYCKKQCRNFKDFKTIKFSEGVPLTPELCQVMFDISLKNLHKRLTKFKNKKVIVLTHHAPSLRSCLEQYKQDPITAAFTSNLEQFILDHSNIYLWVHGHIHNTSGYQLGNTYVCCNPLGYIHYNEQTNFVNNLIVDI